MEAARAAIELYTRQAIFIPPWNRNLIPVPAQQEIIEPRWASADLAEEINTLWIDSFEVGRPAASRRTWSSLSAYGVPGAATNLRVIDQGTLLLPFFGALISGQVGNRVAVLEAVTGQFHPALSSAFTQHAPYLIERLYAGRSIEPS